MSEQEQRLTEISSTLKSNQQNINRRIKTLKRLLNELQGEIEQQATYFDLFREAIRGRDFFEKLKNVLGCKSSIIQSTVRNLKFLANRKKIDKIFLEYLGIIETSQRRNPTKKATKSAFLTVGNLCGDVRALKESGSIKESERGMIVAMLEQLKEEI